MRELDYGNIGIRIRQARKAKGWSQEGFAKRCGISMSFLGHIERGTRIMSLDMSVTICSVLDMYADSYARYVRIMKSVAEIMNEA